MRVSSVRPTTWVIVGLTAFATLAVALVIALVTSSVGQVGAVADDESTFVPVTPVRILDTRDPVNLGLDGPFVSPLPQVLQVTGPIPTAEGTQTVVPPGATGVVLNVTAVQPAAAGFLSLRPAGLLDAPTTSNLNFEAGSIVPNAVTVNLPTGGAADGKIEIVYDAFGQLGPTTDVLVDLVGFHVRDGLQDLAARLTALESELALTSAGRPIVIRYGPGSWMPMSHQVFAPSDFLHRHDGSFITGDGHAMVSLTSPAEHGGVEYTLTEIGYCVHNLAAGARIESVHARGFTGPNMALSIDSTTRTVPGCYSQQVNEFVRASESFQFHVEVGNGGNAVLGTVTATFEPR